MGRRRPPATGSSRVCCPTLIPPNGLRQRVRFSFTRNGFRQAYVAFNLAFVDAVAAENKPPRFPDRSVGLPLIPSPSSLIGQIARIALLQAFFRKTER